MKTNLLRQLGITLVILVVAGICACGVIAQNQKQAESKIFQDVPTNSWVYPAVMSLQKHGILIGYPDTRFNGERKLTRYEFAVPVKRVLDVLRGGELKASDFQSEDLTNINRLVTEFSEELKALGTDMDKAKGQLMALTQIVASQQAMPPINPRLVTADNTFGFHLFRELRKKDTDTNVFLSPSSVALALEMTYNGANGSTKAAMEKALQIQGMSMEEVNKANAVLLASLKSPDPAVQLDIANGLWISKEGQGTPVKPDFVQRNREFYGAEIGDLAGAPDNVNAWVNQKTYGKITKMLERSDLRDAVAVLMNAVYFKGAWTQKFDPAKTGSGTFTDSKGNKLPAHMMSQSGNYNYFQGDHFQMVDLPYGSGRMSMELLLPDANTPLSVLEASLTTDNWNRWITGLRKRHGDIQIPRLELHYEADLIPSLTALGMGEAFKPAADFSGIASGIYITKAKHKTYLAVNEEGTEAAAATVVVMSRGMALGFRFTADRPFLCAIRDNKTGAILFLGAINAPKAS
ncbi:MAG TPA: serpin family protein [Chthonomonadaceae bacterium]|nr:serpin family protein [Chthonomonadaceae bacterium]